MKPHFYVRGLPVYGDAILAPMAGYSDVPYRLLCRTYGSAMHYTEFVPVEALLGRKVHERFQRRLDTQAGEYPMVFQIFGNDAQKLLQAAMRIQAWGPDIIDINMGCSTRKVSGRGAGVGMMPQPDLVAETFRLLSSHLDVPVTGKIRLGWNATQQNYLEIGRIMEENGAALVAMHGRTKEQKYGGRSDWQAIAALKQALSIPVIGNGDVKEAADIDRMKEQTGCDAVMIGRAAIGNPWIFSRKTRSAICFPEVVAAIRCHGSEMAAYYGERYGLIQFRKHLKRYVAGVPGIAPIVGQLLAVESLEIFDRLLGELETAVPSELSLSELMEIETAVV